MAGSRINSHHALRTERAHVWRKFMCRRCVAEQGAEAVGNSPEEFAAFIRAEVEKYARIAKATGVRANP